MGKSFLILKTLKAGTQSNQATKWEKLAAFIFQHDNFHFIEPLNWTFSKELNFWKNWKWEDTSGDLIRGVNN